MMTDDVKRVVRRHRTAAVVGGLTGLIALTGWIGYVIAVTPEMPVISNATASEVVAYISDERGLGKLAEIEQARFLDRWKEHVKKEENRIQLRECLDRLDDTERKQFVESISRHLKRSFMEDAEAFARLSDPAGKHAFLRERIAEYHNRTLFIKDVAKAFRSEFRGQEQIEAWILKHTTPKEQVVGERYVEALKRVDQQLKKEGRADEANPPSRTSDS